MSTEQAFQVRTYGMQELALCYFANSIPASATCQLKKWIQHNEKLSVELQNTGYCKGQKLFTPLQVKIIVQYLGEP